MEDILLILFIYDYSYCQKDKDYYQKYIDNNIANDFNRVVEFIGYFNNVYSIARRKTAETNKE